MQDVKVQKQSDDQVQKSERCQKAWDLFESLEDLSSLTEVFE